MRPDACRRTGGPGEGSPAGGDCAPARAGEVCLREAAGGSFSAQGKLGGRGRAGGAGSRPLRAGGSSGRVGFCTEGGSREGPLRWEGLPLREKSLRSGRAQSGEMGLRGGVTSEVGGVPKCVKEGGPLGWKKRSPFTPAVVTFGRLEVDGVCGLGSPRLQKKSSLPGRSVPIRTHIRRLQSKVLCTQRRAGRGEPRQPQSRSLYACFSHAQPLHPWNEATGI